MQQILVDQEFCDQNIFTYYQRQRKVQPKTFICDYQPKNLTRQHGNANQQKFQFKPKIFQSASLPKKNFTNRGNSSIQYKNLKSLSTETPQIEQKKQKFRSFIGILAKNKLIQNSKQKNLQIQSRENNLKQGMRNTSVQRLAPNRSLQRLITQFLSERITNAQIRNTNQYNFTSCQLISKQK